MQKFIQYGSPSNAVVRQSDVTALSEEAVLVTLFSTGSEWDSTVVPSDFDRLISGYRLVQTALLRDPYSIAKQE